MTKYLQPYKDEEMVYEALELYAARREAFAKQIADPEYEKADGSKATEEEIAFAMSCAEQAKRLVKYAREKVESPIIVMQ